MAEHISGITQSLYWRHDEAELVTELQAGSDQAFEWLVTYFHGPVYSLVYGILSDPADAADVTQEVFLRAFKGIGGFRRGSSLKTWLYRISVREALNHRRWCWRHRRGQVSIDDDQGRAVAAAELPDLEATPFEQLATHETQAVVRRALNEVPPVFRSAVILRDLEGLSYDDIAEILEVSVGTVKSRILRGRRALRQLLDPVLHASHTRPRRNEAAGGETTSSPRSIDRMANTTGVSIPASAVQMSAAAPAGPMSIVARQDLARPESARPEPASQEFDQHKSPALHPPDQEKLHGAKFAHPALRLDVGGQQ